MKVVSVAEFKTHFSSLLDHVRAGGEIAIQYGRRKEAVARLVPATTAKSNKRRLGLLAGKASFKMHRKFKMSDEELLAG